MIAMASLEELQRMRSQKEAAFREQRRSEKDQRKAQRGIRRAETRSYRSKARQAAKEAYPDSRLVLVFNGRPISVREVERPAEVVRSQNIMARRVDPYRESSMNILPAYNMPSYNVVPGIPVEHAGPCTRGCAGCDGTGCGRKTTQKKAAKGPTGKTAAKKTAPPKKTVSAKKTVPKKSANTKRKTATGRKGAGR